MSRSVPIDPARYGVRPGFLFRKWGAARSLSVLDWIADKYGPNVAESAAQIVRAVVLGTASASEAGQALGGILRAHGQSGSWEAFLDMAAVDETGAGLWRAGAKGGEIPVWSRDPAMQRSLQEKGLHPDAVFADDPLEALRLLAAMLAETFRPFGEAWSFIAPIFGLAKVGAPEGAPKPPASPS